MEYPRLNSPTFTFKKSCQETYSEVLKALDSSDAKSETLSLKDLKDLDHRFWLLTISCVVTYCSVLPFNNVASDLLQDRYDYQYAICSNDIYTSLYLMRLTEFLCTRELLCSFMWNDRSETKWIFFFLPLSLSLSLSFGGIYQRV